MNNTMYVESGKSEDVISREQAYENELSHLFETIAAQSKKIKELEAENARLREMINGN